VRKKSTAEELSIDELRRLLVEKRRASRRDRLERFRRTGRVVVVTPDVESGALDTLRSGDLAVGPTAEVARPARSRARTLLDALLLLIELAAVGGLLFVLFSGITMLRELNQEVASALELPTPSPTPLIVAVILPSGHTPPNSPGGARPNEAEIPDHLKPLVQSLAQVAIPTPGPEQAIRIQIPLIRVDAPVVQGDSWEQLKKGVGQHIGHFCGNLPRSRPVKTRRSGHAVNQPAHVHVCGHWQ
jgi:sortase A